VQTELESRCDETERLRSHEVERARYQSDQARHGLKGVIVNLVVRRVRKMVPAYSVPGVVTFNEAVAAGRNMKSPPMTVSRSCSPSASAALVASAEKCGRSRTAPCSEGKGCMNWANYRQLLIVFPLPEPVIHQAWRQ
jgi:hypothetical protein